VQHDDTATFRLPRLWQIGFFAIAVLGSCARLLTAIIFGRYLSLSLIEFAALVLFWIFFLRGYTVELRPDGIKLFRLWWLPWTDVVAARYIRLLGLPSFRVKRRRGFSWSIPLYFVGDCDLRQAIIRTAPPGNPLRSVSMPD
jgi:hypothetical protein